MLIQIKLLKEPCFGGSIHDRSQAVVLVLWQRRLSPPKNLLQHPQQFWHERTSIYLDQFVPEQDASRLGQQNAS